MFERLDVINEMGGIGFIIAPIVRYNLYKTPKILNEWKGEEFDSILKSIRSRLRPSTGLVAGRPSSSVALKTKAQNTSTSTKVMPNNEARKGTDVSHDYLSDQQKLLEVRKKKYEKLKKTLPDNHPNIADSVNNLGESHSNLGEHFTNIT